MKRLICLMLIFCLLLSGCSMVAERMKEPVTFYYVRKNYQKDMAQVIASELREASGHSEDLPYLLALYSLGPSSEDLKALLPRSTSIIPTERSESNITLTLSENALTLSDADYTLASACIAMTCMELIDVQQVTVLCGDKTITIGADSLLLHGNIVEQSQEEIN